MENNQNFAETGVDNEAPEQIRIRAEKRARLLAEGIDPYPVELPLTTTIKQVIADPHSPLPPFSLLKLWD